MVVSRSSTSGIIMILSWSLPPECATTAWHGRSLTFSGACGAFAGIYRVLARSDPHLPVALLHRNP
ncbi:MAG: hypothetical protein M3008_13860 [Chloroflexota bacterium]|nr:hypothetical protein [Chloroflexota bacterium]